MVELDDAALIGIQGHTVIAIWPGPLSAVRRIALEATPDGRFVLVVDDQVLESHKDIRNGLNALRKLDPWTHRSLLDSHGQTLVAAEPGHGYPVKRFALERTGDALLLVADGQVLDRFGSAEVRAALTAFRDVSPGPLAMPEDLYP